MEDNDNVFVEDCHQAVDPNANDSILKRNIHGAEIRMDELRKLRKSLTDTFSQVTICAKNHKKDVEDVFSAVTEALVKALDERKRQLLQEISSHVEDVVLPIIASQDAVDVELQLTSDYLDKAKREDGKMFPDQDASQLHRFSECLLSAESFMNVTVHFNQALISQTLDDISKFGLIHNMSSIQIVETEERPGALALRWEEKDYESEFESNFRLQCCFGDVRKDKSLTEKFTDVYTGCDSVFVVRHLETNTDYSFRVCRHGAAVLDWSLPLVAQTNLLPYVWNTGNTNYNITNGGKTATKMVISHSILFSSSPQFKYKHSTQFKIERCASRSDEDGVGLWLPIANSESSSVIQPGVIFVGVEGYIYVNGVRMTTRLPKFSEGSVITFDSDEQLVTNKMRITITHEEKQVTYDWNLDGVFNKREKEIDSGSESGNCDSVYFFVSFQDHGWSVVVQ